MSGSESTAFAVVFGGGPFRAEIVQGEAERRRL
jgi:hypothetical protein